MGVAMVLSQQEKEMKMFTGPQVFLGPMEGVLDDVNSTKSYSIGGRKEPITGAKEGHVHFL
jgi:hypothetical protein